MPNETINLVNVAYKQTGKSINTNDMGMREMQQRAYEKRASKHLLIKAPPASGKSRALMYIGLDKLGSLVKTGRDSPFYGSLVVS